MKDLVNNRKNSISNNGLGADLLYRYIVEGLRPLMISFCLQNPQLLLLLLSCWLSEPPTCGSNPTPTPSSETGPSYWKRWSIGRPLGTGQKPTLWTLPITNCGIWIQMWSMRSECCWLALEKEARDHLDHHSQQGQNVQVVFLLLSSTAWMFWFAYWCINRQDFTCPSCRCASLEIWMNFMDFDML